MMHTIWNNREKYESYFMPSGWYFSGDSAYMDEDGYFWFQGRVDDVIMTSGERVGPFEVESKLVEHPAIAEAGVIGKPDPVRGKLLKLSLPYETAMYHQMNLRKRFDYLLKRTCRTRCT